jgi:hypothetical protein
VQAKILVPFLVLKLTNTNKPTSSNPIQDHLKNTNLEWQVEKEFQDIWACQVSLG